MRKKYSIIVRKDTVEGNQWNPIPCTRTIRLGGKGGKMYSSREEAEEQRQVYHSMSQEAMRKKHGDGFYHGLEIVEHDIHEPGEARIKWKKVDKPYTMDFFRRMCEISEKTGCDTFLLKVQRECNGETQGKERFMILNIGKTADDGYSGSLNDSMHFDYIDKLRVYGWAAIMEEPEEK
jgi:hypothetical protein